MNLRGVLFPQLATSFIDAKLLMGDVLAIPVYGVYSQDGCET
jgi:hypothetical protein